MDFLKEIVKEIGDEYTQLASEAESTETFIDTGSYIFNGLVSGSIFGGVSRNKITAIAGEKLYWKDFFQASLWLKIFLTIILMGIVYILIQKPLSTEDSLSLEELISKGSWLSMW